MELPQIHWLLNTTERSVEINTKEWGWSKAKQLLNPVWLWESRSMYILHRNLNVRSEQIGKLNIDILGISETNGLEWNSDDRIIRNQKKWVTFAVNKTGLMQYWMQSQTTGNNLCSQGKPFNRVSKSMHNQQCWRSEWFLWTYKIARYTQMSLSL